MSVTGDDAGALEVIAKLYETVGVSSCDACARKFSMFVRCAVCEIAWPYCAGHAFSKADMHDHNVTLHLIVKA